MHYLKLINKRYDLKLSSLDIISVLFILFIIANPLVVYNMSFKLSFLASFIIILISQTMAIYNVNINGVYSMILMTVVVQIGTFPIVINLNNSYNLFSILANILFVYLISSLRSDTLFLLKVLSVIATSTDGRNWTLQTSGVSENLYGIIYDGTQFVATGNNGTIIKSTDGESWETINSGISADLKEIAYGNGLYVIAPGVYYSSDLTTWNTASVSSRGRVFFHKNNFYTCSYGGSYDELYIYKSSDAVTWTSVTSPNVYDASWNIVSAAGDYIYASSLTYSDDGGTTWKSLTSGNNPFNVVYGNGIYAGTNYQHFSISSDGLAWTKVSDIYGSMNKTIYGNGLFIWLSSENSALKVILYSDALSVYTTDENPTTESTVYSAVGTVSALTITSVGTGTITLSDTNTYSYNSAGNQTVTQNVGQAHPDWLCFIEGVGIKMGNVSFIPTVDQTYNASSTNAQSGVAVASGISDTLGTIETALQGV